MKPKFFRTAGGFHKWLDRHHPVAPQFLVGFYKADSGRPSMTWPESVDEALCFGWIDGVRKRVDDVSYTIRFSPRRATSIWSAINIAKVRMLTAAGRMQPAGLKAFKARKEHKSRIYSYEQHEQKLDPASEKALRKNPAAWKFFQAQAPWYRRLLSWKITSAKKAETKRKWLEKLIAASAAGKRL